MTTAVPGRARTDLLDRQRSVVVVVDVQGRLVDQVEEPDRLRAAIARLTRIAGLFQIPLVVTEQYPGGLGTTERGVMEVVQAQPSQHRVVDKTSFSCCGEPTFFDAVRELRPGLREEKLQVVLVGIEAHVCVLQTALDLLGRGVSVVLCPEAISGRGPRTRRNALEEMSRVGARLAHHESVGFEWAREKDHPAFKEFSGLLREGQID